MPNVADVPWLLRRAQAEAWRLACGDPNPLPAQAQAVAPPMAVVLGSVCCVADPLLRGVHPQLTDLGPSTLLHGDEDVTWHRPLRVEQDYRVSGKIVSQARSQAGLVLRILANVDLPDGRPVASTLSSLFFSVHRQVAGEGGRADPPISGEQVATAHWQVAQDQPERYAAASGDANPLHLNDALAQTLGLERRPLHGMCSLAFAARSLAAAHGEGGALRLASLRGRFRRPVYPGDTLTCRSALQADGRTTFGVFNQAGGAVIARGVAKFVQPSIASASQNEQTSPS